MSNVPALVSQHKTQFLAVVSDPAIEWEREFQFACQILQNNSYTAGIAASNPNSLKNAIVNVAAIGISLNPASKLAYLVPRNKAVCLDISYMGLMHIAVNSGAIMWGQAVIVRDADKFAMRGIDQEPQHEYNPFATDRGEIVGVYAVVKLPSGDYLTHAMPISKVNDIRDRSESWKAGKKGPWATDPEEMIKKTCVKQAAKYWPRRDRLDAAIHNQNTDAGEGITIEAEKMPADEFDKHVKAIQATTNHDAAKAAYLAAVEICRELKDKASADALKEITVAHREFIDKANKAAAE